MDRPAEGEPSSPSAPYPSSSQPPPPLQPPPTTAAAATATLSSGQPSRYESQKRRDWNTFLHYLKGIKPSPLTPPLCGGAHVLEFLKYLDQFGKTKVHDQGCAYFGQPHPPDPCPCPLRQAWGSLDALIGRLRAAYEESGGRPESNPFAAMPVRIYLRGVRDSQSKARGIPFEKKRKRRLALASPSSSSPSAAAAAAAAAASSTASTSVPTKEMSFPGGGSGGVSPGDGDGV